ncbi:MAG: type II toxin-antitoxin system VapC family toxin [Candidatus Eisenbacteria bacterium]|nr:type II toxin-antitoxin system VapC family toxin [Candidatus Eisenbacteria bacterium]
MILVDSNVIMYLVGAPHPHKLPAQRQLESAMTARERLVTDAEVLQEILHRYTAINRREAIQPAFDALLGVVEEVFPVTLEEVLRARTITLGHPRLSARDALHLAIMESHGITRIMSFDRAFDGFPGVRRIGD